MIYFAKIENINTAECTMGLINMQIFRISNNEILLLFHGKIKVFKSLKVIFSGN
jgi:hypothetical protein